MVNKVKLVVMNNDKVAEMLNLRVTLGGEAAKVKATKGNKFLLVEEETGFAPENISAQRVGNDLHVSLEGTEQDQPQAVLQGYYEGEGKSLLGQAENGSYYEYIPTDANPSNFVGALADGTSAPLALGGGGLDVAALGALGGAGAAAAGGLSAGAIAALAALGLAGIVGGISARNNGGGNNNGTGSEEGRPAKQVITGATDNEGPKTGPLKPGDITDDTTPTFTGTGQPGNTITITDNGTPIGTTTVGGDGTWTFTPNSPLDPGTHNITSAATTPGGQTGDPSDPFQLIIDTSTPDKPVIDINNVMDDVGPVIGYIKPNDTTDDTMPTFNGGPSKPGNTITFYDNGKEIGSTTVKPNGSWTFTPPTPLDSGTHSITTTETGANGKPSTPSDPFNFTVDTAPPSKPVITEVFDDQAEVPGALVNGATTADAKPDFKGTAEANSTVIIRDGNKELGRTTADGSGNWTFTPETPLLIGAHNITASAVDKAGNEGERSDVASFTVNIGSSAAQPAIINVIDDSVPGVANNIGKGDVTKDSTPVIKGTGKPGDTIKVYDGEKEVGSTTVLDNGTWSLATAVLPDGPHTLTATATTPEGAVSPATGPYYFSTDTTAPEASTSQVLSDNVGPQTGTINNNDVTDDATPTYSGKAEPNSFVTILDKGVTMDTVRADEFGNWTYTLNAPLTDGPHSFTTIVKDPAGNASPQSAPLNFMVDTSGVVIAINQVIDDKDPVTGNVAHNGFINDTQPDIVGKATPSSVVSVYDGTTLLGTTTASGSGFWSFTTPALGQGEHNITATSTSAAGVVSPATGPFTFTVDTTAPEKSTIANAFDDVQSDIGLVASGGFTNDATPTFSGKGEAGATIQITDNVTGLLGSTTVKDDGTWSFTPTTPLPEGAHSFTATAIDKAGNVGQPSDPYVLILDTTAPIASASITGMSKDSGANSGDFATNNGDEGRGIFGTLSGTLGAGEKVQVSTDGGKTWIDAVVNGANWAAVDNNAHSGNWAMDVRVVDQAGNVGVINTTQVTLDTEAPLSLSSITVTPMRTGNGFPFVDTTAVRVGFADTGAKAGDVVNIYGSAGYQGSFVLTEADVSGTNTFLTLTVPGHVPASGIYANIVDQYGNASEYITGTGGSVSTLPPAYTGSVSGPYIAQYTGTAGNDEFVLANTSYFERPANETIPGIHGGAGTDTLKLTGTGGAGTLDLTKLTGFSDQGKISSIEKFDMTAAGSQTLNISLKDVLNLGGKDLFQESGKTQVMVNGDASDKVNLSSLIGNDANFGAWSAPIQTTIGGTTYNVYEHSSLQSQLLVQEGVQVALV